MEQGDRGRSAGDDGSAGSGQLGVRGCAALAPKQAADLSLELPALAAPPVRVRRFAQWRPHGCGGTVSAGRGDRRHPRHLRDQPSFTGAARNICQIAAPGVQMLHLSMVSTVQVWSVDGHPVARC